MPPCVTQLCLETWSLQKAGILLIEEDATANGKEPWSGDVASYKATW